MRWIGNLFVGPLPPPRPCKDKLTTVSTTCSVLSCYILVVVVVAAAAVFKDLFSN